MEWWEASSLLDETATTLFLFGVCKCTAISLCVFL